MAKVYFSSAEISNNIKHLEMFYKMITGSACNLNFQFRLLPEDWIFHPLNQKTILFNTSLREFCSAEYYSFIVIHEFYHYINHRIVEKTIVKFLKDNYGEIFMRIFDIEADLYTAIYFHKKCKVSFNEFIKIHHESIKVFKDKKTRLGKLARHFGSLLSISNYYRNQQNTLFLPSLDDAAFNKEVSLIKISDSHHSYWNFPFRQEELDELINLYTDYTLDSDSYLERVTKLVNKILN